MITQTEITDRLTQCGWTVEVPWLATKFYDDAVGGRNAAIFVHGSKITAEYISIGENALSTCDGFMLNPSGLVQHIDDIDGFLREVDRRIDATYARRLLIRGVK